MSQHTARLRAFDNGMQHEQAVSYDIHFDVHTKTVHTSVEDRLELYQRGETPPPAEMIFITVRNLYITITTAGTSRRIPISAVSSDLPPINEQVLDEAIKALLNYKKEYEGRFA